MCESAEKPSTSGNSGRLRAFWRRRRTVLVWAVPLAFYCLIGSTAAIRMADRIDTDAVCYIRLAGYLAEGNVSDSISGWWSPLFIWLTAPFLALGMDGLHAARLVVFLSGAGFVAASWLLLRRLTSLPEGWTLAALMILALVAARWVVRQLSPDLALGACLALYFAWSASPDLLTSRRRQLACGLLGGLSYLAKAYAFPFFLVHFPMAIVLRLLIGRGEAAEGPPSRVNERSRSRPVRVAASAWAVGVVGFVLVAGPWVGAVSWKHGRLAYTTAGGANHAVAGPGDMNRDFPMFRGLWVPREGAITVWETPEVLPFKEWSPLESRAYFARQVKQSARTAWTIRRYVSAFDVLGLSLAVAALSPVIALAALALRRREDAFRFMWLFGTVALYSLGYALVLTVQRRHIEPALLPACFGLCLHLAVTAGEKLREKLRQEPKERREAPSRAGRIAGILPAIVVAASFAIVPAGIVSKSLAEGNPASLRAAAARIEESGCRGPLASNSWTYGLWVSYHMDEVFLGRPAARSPGERDTELRSKGVATFVVWRPAGAAAEIPGWSRRLSVQAFEMGPGIVLDAYVPLEP